ncbi:hypothetical protein AVEN_103253-1 [Araneus ventricosus]|uniref:Helitron helicase-like domain-containing protein n=1 Tax=Araneus ventricosus TaxID=182803 RepID=A0A4Y2S5T6_ARAVE|nr:hypothetical protein AVEN_103253-1 [Araneus ventricosus]
MLRSIIVELCRNSAVFVGLFIGRKRKILPISTQNDGKVQLPAFPDAPELLKALLTENSPDAKNYRQRIREYNFALAFASLEAQIKPPRRTGPYCYRLHGQVYHRVSPLYASDQHKESYGQLYIFDSSEATEKRLSNKQNCL